VGIVAKNAFNSMNTLNHIVHYQQQET